MCCCWQRSALPGWCCKACSESTGCSRRPGAESICPLIIALALFIVLFPFWLAKKVGAGDVKLMAAVPLVAGAENMLPFALLLMVFALITAFVVKNPMMLPSTLFRQYVEHFERKGVVPFGVPIAAQPARRRGAARAFRPDDNVGVRPAGWPRRCPQVSVRGASLPDRSRDRPAASPSPLAPPSIRGLASRRHPRQAA